MPHSYDGSAIKGEQLLKTLTEVAKDVKPNADMYVAKYGVISEFTAMTNARGDKKICVAVGLGGGSSGFNSAEAIVPLTYVEFGSGGAVVAFYFNLPRDSYGDVNARGSILQVKFTRAG